MDKSKVSKKYVNLKVNVTRSAKLKFLKIKDEVIETWFTVV